MMPNYLVSMSDDAVILRNYEGMLIRYQAEDKPNSPQATNTRGVSGLLQGDKTVLMPEGNERMTRRRKLNVIDPGYDTGCGDGEAASDGTHRPILPLPMMNTNNGNGHAANG